eukprot:scaffold232113_cov48-Prasinocladus_malaysianus.AAC.1
MWLFVGGFAVSAVVFAFPISTLSNGIGLWINIAPGDMLVYTFLPGLLLNECLRIQFNSFKRYMAQALVLAFPVAILATALLVLFMLYGLGLGAGFGWTATHACLFGSVVMATDAVS